MAILVLVAWPLFAYQRQWRCLISVDKVQALLRRLTPVLQQLVLGLVVSLQPCNHLPDHAVWF